MSTLQKIELKASDLNHNGGIYCPSPKNALTDWNGHPKVFLDIAKTGHAKCPYCGAEYALAAGEHAAGGH